MDRLSEAFHHCGLAHARLADQNRIVLGPARKHLNYAPQFLVAADYRIELALAGELREIAPERVDRGRLLRLAVSALRATGLNLSVVFAAVGGTLLLPAALGTGGEKLLHCDTRVEQKLRGGVLAFAENRRDKMHRTDDIAFSRLHAGDVEHLARAGGERKLTALHSGDGTAGNHAPHRFGQTLHRQLQPLQAQTRLTFGNREYRQQNMLRTHMIMTELLGAAGRRVQRVHRIFGKCNIHDKAPSLASTKTTSSNAALILSARSA